MKTEATEALPAIRFLDEAARAAGAREDWRDGTSFVMRGTTRNSVIAHARTLERIEQLERESETLLAAAKLSVRQRDAALGALRRIAEGNLGDAPWQANYAKIRDVAATTLAQIDAITEGEGL